MDLKPLFVFPRWSNTVTLSVILFMAVFPLYAVVLVAYALDPVTLNVGYQPVQPIPYSHKLHVGELGLDCRYCHNTVEKADFAAIPPTETCMNCHKTIRANSEKLKPLRESYLTGLPVEWHAVTTLPDYVYFNHSAHVNSGISCVECHGQINQMEQVYQAKPMNMAWCLQCHRDPETRIRPKNEITHLDWKPGKDDASTVNVFANLPDAQLKSRYDSLQVSDQNVLDAEKQFGAAPLSAEAKKALATTYLAELGQTKSVDAIKRDLGQILKERYHVNPNTDCVTCHR